jgi:hypothetical protein
MSQFCYSGFGQGIVFSAAVDFTVSISSEEIRINKGYLLAQISNQTDFE